MKIDCWGEYKPKYGSESAAGIDLYNNDNDGDIILYPGAPVMINTKTRMEIPEGHVGLLFVRSSVGKRLISLSNSTAVIDSDYRGDIMAHLVYSGDAMEEIKLGERFCQIVIVPYRKAELEFVDELSETERGNGGFGSTGTL